MRIRDLLSSVIVAAAMLTAWGPGAARADMMAACKSEIGTYCSDVSNGRGRIWACLAGQSSHLGAACKPEVQAVAQKSRGNVLVPAGVRKMMGSGSAPAVPAACSADAGKFCSGVGGGSGNVLTCLYARSDKVSKGCSSEMKTVLR